MAEVTLIASADTYIKTGSNTDNTILWLGERNDQSGGAGVSIQRVLAKFDLSGRWVTKMSGDMDYTLWSFPQGSSSFAPLDIRKI